MYKQIFKKRVLFIGVPDMAYICLDGLHMSGANIVGVLGAKKDHPTYMAFKRFTQLSKLNFIEYNELDDIFLIDKIRDLQADIAVVCSYNHKIPEVFLNSVKDGFINVHPSLLPKYRGANPYSAVIMNGEKETGVTLHFMDKKFDTGDIISQKRLAISEMETMGTLFNRLNILALNMLLETLKEYEQTELKRQKQPEGEFVRGKAIREELSFINYEKTAEEIERFIRALNPFFIATTNFRSNIVKIFATEIINEKSKEPAGTIVKIENDRFYVATKDGLLMPSALQFGSFFAGTAKDFIKVLNPKIGERFS